MVETKSLGSKIFDAFNYILLAAIGFACLYPFMYVVFASLSDPAQILQHDFVLLWWPKGFSLESYKQVFDADLITGYINTLIYVVGGTAISMLLTILGAYVLSRKHYLMKKPITIAIMFTMYFSGGIVPFYLWLQDLNMIDTRWAILLPMALNTYNMIVMRTAFANVPESLLEAAKLDGASEFTCLFRIVVPLSMSTILVVMLFYAVARWNEWLPAAMFLRSRELYPLQIFLRETLLTSSADAMVATGGDSSNTLALSETIKYATIVVSTLPILVVYPFIQKYFISGMMVGGVKE